MRISTQQIFKPGVAAMQDMQTQISRIQQQLATGKKILNPADDPAAAVRALDLQDAVDTHKQFQRNADAVRGRLEQEEGVIDSMQNLLQRVHELNLQGNNSSNNANDRRAIAGEVRQHLESLVQLVNTRDASGDYIFAGFKTRVPPLGPNGSGGYQYDGDDGRRLVQVGPERGVEMGDPASAFFDDLAAAGGGTTNMTAILEDLASALDIDSDSQDTLIDLNTAMEAVSTVQARIGSRLNAVDDQYETNETALLALETNRSTLEDLDFADAITQLNLQLTALQAAQQSFVKIQNLSLFNFL